MARFRFNPSYRYSFSNNRFDPCDPFRSLESALGLDFVVLPDAAYACLDMYKVVIT